MKIKKIEIKSLFGYFDHVIPLRADERITIIHGPNGVGKTTVLRLVYDLFRGRFHTLLITPFDSITIYFESNCVLTVKRSKSHSQETPVKLVLTYNAGSKPVAHTISPLSEELIRRYSLSMIDRVVENLERIGPTEWRDEITGETMFLDEVVLRYAHLFPPEIRRMVVQIPDEIKQILESVSIVLVETQRLFTMAKEEDSSYRRRSEGIKQKMAVEQYSQDMILRIQDIQSKSGVLGASLDRTFPQRLLRDELPSEANERSIRRLYTGQSEYRDRLMRAGLIAAETPVSLPAGNLKTSERKVLWIYLNDVKKKLEVFDHLLRCVELFKDIINSRFSYKEFLVEREKGFIFKSKHQASVVPPRSLSSGEQHEIVLTYQLLFKAKAGSLIFIDEPELSLHVIWQRKFLEDIARISQLANLDFLVATHSPSIINDRRDLMVKLGGDGED